MFDPVCWGLGRGGSSTVPQTRMNSMNQYSLPVIHYLYNTH